MVNLIFLPIAALIGYVFGAIPFGFIYVKLAKNEDVRQVGSGRTGGTNSFRAAGLGVGIATALSDVLKGFAGVLVTRLLLIDVAPDSLLPWLLVTAGVFAVIGHNWSIFLKWAGGAGTGPNVGWAAAIWWPMFPVAFLVMVGLLLGVGMASVASLAMAAVIPIVFAIRLIAGIDATAAYLVGGIIAALVVTWALRPNIKRLIQGRERIVGPRAKRKQRLEAKG